MREETSSGAPVDVYVTAAQYCRTETKVKGSRFIAEAFPVADEAEAAAAIGHVRRREYDATHHCTAFRLGPDGASFRYDDDGEPSGTAGQPILRQIDGRGLTNTLVVVTRYYGGTRLGTGGLVRAYGDAAAEALEGAGRREHVLRVPVRLRFDYADTSPAMHLLGRYDTEIQATTYGHDTTIVAAVRTSEVEAFVAAFVEALAGRGRAARLDEG